MKRRTALQFGLACGITTAWRRIAGAGAASMPAPASAAPAPDAPAAEEAAGFEDNACRRRLGHAAAAPLGVGADSAAKFLGGRGEGQHLIDVEQGWTLTHDSLLAHRIGPPLAGTIDDRSRPHGTAVLGIVCGASTTGGYVGLAPKVASVHVASTVENLRAAIKTAIDHLAAINEADRYSGGGVLLLETQARIASSQGGMGHLPIEALPQFFELIAGATGRGITVIEAGGNGRDTVGAPEGIDLDEFVDLNGSRILRRDSPRGDSGAIIVAAARADVVDGQHERYFSSNFGSRIDCYAWGESVIAPSSTPTAPFSASACVGDFGETSAAAAIIAGVALIVQGIVAAAQPGRRLAPRQLREILGRRALGTRCVSASGEIGVMPDLAKILAAGVLGVTPVRRSQQTPAAERG